MFKRGDGFVELWAKDDFANFARKCAAQYQKTDQKILYRALKPLKKSIGDRAGFFGDVARATNNKVDLWGEGRGATKWESLGSASSGDNNFFGVAYALYLFQPNFCCAHTGLIGEEQHDEFFGKKLWEIIPSLPEPGGVDRQNYIGSVREEFLTKHNGTALRSDSPKPRYQSWHLVPHKKTSVDEKYNNFNLDAMGQPARVGEPIEVYLDITSEPQYTAAGYAFGFKSVRVKTSINSNVDCEIGYNLEYQTHQQVGKSAIVQLLGGRTSGTMKVSSIDGLPLSQTICCYQKHFFTLRPYDERYEFSAEMWTNLHDGSLVRPNGEPLPSREKEVVILSLLVRAIVKNPENNGDYVLSEQRFLVEPREISTALER